MNDLLHINNKALWLAILIQAIKDYIAGVYKDAYYWIRSDDEIECISFINVCKYLDIDHKAVRKKIFALTPVRARLFIKTINRFELLKTNDDVIE
jgi:hypothetical protein